MRSSAGKHGGELHAGRIGKVRWIGAPAHPHRPGAGWSICRWRHRART
ncbi:MAG: hypothetical protein LBE06_01025 [Azoarcus sp.]|nr:hypothetical protein [Azoarcus sp.]